MLLVLWCAGCSEQVIVDDHQVLDDLPPAMRSELVRRLYGSIVTSVPIFVGLDSAILTELCMSLRAEPALRRQVLTVEGSRGTGLHCISSGACRVSRIERGREDDIRIKMWIEDVYEGNGRPLTLFASNMRMYLEQLLQRLHLMARNKKNSTVAQVLWYRDVFDDLEVEEIVVESGVKLTTLLSGLRKQKALFWSGPLKFSTPTSDGPAIELAASPKELEGEASLAMLCSSLRDGVVLGELLNFILPKEKRLDISRPTLMADVGAAVTESIALTEDVMHTGLNVTTNIVDASQQATFGAAGKLVSAVPDSVGRKALASAVDKVEGVAISTTTNIMSAGDSIKTAEMMTDVADTVTVIPNLQKIVSALTDPDLPFRLPPETCLRVDDLRLYDRGAFHVQAARQNRVLKCLLDLAWRVSTLDGYTGPRLDAVTLGILGPGEFFGELSLLPLSGQPWRHTRTHTAMCNSILYFLSKESMQDLARRFPDLKQLLADHVEDYQDLHSRLGDTVAPLSKGGHAVEKARARTDLAHEVQVDPVAHLQEALEQLDAKVCESDRKMDANWDELNRKVNEIDNKLDGFMEKVLGMLSTQ